MMFVLCVSVIIYIFYFCFSLASLEYKTYVEFMLGRTITSSSPTYTFKQAREGQVLQQFHANASQFGPSTVTGDLTCLLEPSKGYRGTMLYGTNNVNYDVTSNAGIACGLSMPHVLPSMLTGNSSNMLKVANRIYDRQ